MNKYGAKRAAGSSGRMYDSTAERDRAEELRLLEAGGEIRDLVEQPRLELESGIFYKPDFAYYERGRLIHEDVKGPTTQRFALIKKIWRLHGPSVLRITKRRSRKAGFQVAQEIMGGGA